MSDNSDKAIVFRVINVSLKYEKVKSNDFQKAELGV